MPGKQGIFASMFSSGKKAEEESSGSKFLRLLKPGYSKADIVVPDELFCSIYDGPRYAFKVSVILFFFQFVLTVIIAVYQYPLLLLVTTVAPYLNIDLML